MIRRAIAGPPKRWRLSISTSSSTAVASRLGLRCDRDDLSVLTPRPP